ncbi:MAG: hypothetical protein PHY95_00905 [Candidatus ainarchaeum sp.]|nr:hypothetical protein [Candidatus ainarchaeum sp.]
MPPKEKTGKYGFEMLRKFSRPRSYIVTRQYKMDMLSILSKAISAIMGGKQ